MIKSNPLARFGIVLLGVVGVCHDVVASQLSNAKENSSNREVAVQMNYPKG
ncbi:MAG: hypothetical protein LW870_05365 [Pirellula sp.]|jgi:hypothetical protein|nr:hypothetical protein [Pirellula sp.]